MLEPTYDLEIEWTVDAPLDDVWSAWTEAPHVSRWLRPSDEWSTGPAKVDLCVGGVYRWEFAPPEDRGYYEEGVFTEVRAHEALEYTCEFGQLPSDFVHRTTIRVSFEQRGSGTRIVVLQTGFPTQQHRDDQQNGWPLFLESLSRYLA